LICKISVSADFRLVTVAFKTCPSVHCGGFSDTALFGKEADKSVD